MCRLQQTAPECTIKNQSTPNTKDLILLFYFIVLLALFFHYAYYFALPFCKPFIDYTKLKH